jgi:hypothetical protein
MSPRPLSVSISCHRINEKHIALQAIPIRDISDRPETRKISRSLESSCKPILYPTLPVVGLNLSKNLLFENETSDIDSLTKDCASADRPSKRYIWMWKWLSQQGLDLCVQKRAWFVYYWKRNPDNADVNYLGFEFLLFVPELSDYSYTPGLVHSIRSSTFRAIHETEKSFLRCDFSILPLFSVRPLQIGKAKRDHQNELEGSNSRIKDTVWLSSCATVSNMQSLSEAVPPVTPTSPGQYSIPPFKIWRRVKGPGEL